MGNGAHNDRWKHGGVRLRTGFLPTLLVAWSTSAWAGPPATVLLHRVSDVVSSATQIQRDVEWTVRIEDPSLCVAGIPAPVGLDGASDRGAIVLETLLVVPSHAVVGDTFTLKRKQTLRGWVRSGAMSTVPDLPVEQVELSVRVTSSLPVAVWTEPSASNTIENGGRTVRASWTDLSVDRYAALAWGAWPDWFEAGDKLIDELNPRMGSREALGRDVAAGLTGHGVQAVTQRVLDSITLDPSASNDWSAARPVGEVTRSGRGSATERAVVLINALQLAGFQALPGGFLAAHSRVLPPLALPSPAAFEHPLVAVVHDDRVQYIDPGASEASAGDMPPTVAGGVVWHSGTQPRVLATGSLVDGSVDVATQVQLTPQGDSPWQLEVTATGDANQRIRDLLSPLDRETREAAILRLLQVARPGLKDAEIQVDGIAGREQSVRISIRATDKGGFTPAGAGRIGRVRPALGPALASWLPPNLLVVERMSLKAPPDMWIASYQPPTDAASSDALLVRAAEQTPDRLNLTTQALRPYRTTSAQRDSEARALLSREARGATDVLLYPLATGATLKALREDGELDTYDRAVLEAHLRLDLTGVAAAGKSLRKATKDMSDHSRFVDALASWNTEDSDKLWATLEGNRWLPETAMSRVAGHLEDVGQNRTAWLLHHELRESSDQDVRAEALVSMARLQGSRPAESDKAAFEAWTEPETLHSQAQALAPHHPDLVALQVAAALEDGQSAQAESLLAAALEVADVPALHVLRAHAAAMSGLPTDEVVDRLHAAVDAGSTDASLFLESASVLRRLQRPHEALRFALTAARLAPDEPGPMAVASELAIEALDIDMAASAAKSASDLDPLDFDLARSLWEVALITGDPELGALARSRGGATSQAFDWPPAVDLVLDALPSKEAAVLEARDPEVRQRPDLLARRARIRLESGRRDAAARDGTMLARTYDRADGQAIEISATVGHIHVAGRSRLLARAAAEDAEASRYRLEHALISGDTDPLAMAGRVADRFATTLAAALGEPDDPSHLLPGWPTEISEPANRTIRGFKTNRWLGAAKGIRAWSDPVRSVAVIRIGAVTGMLPPPLSAVYAAAPNAVGRTPDGDLILALDGGALPLYAATAIDGDEELIGLGFSPSEAAEALRRAR
jgi:hypothetical protein